MVVYKTVARDAAPVASLATVTVHFSEIDMETFENIDNVERGIIDEGSIIRSFTIIATVE